MQPSVQRGPVSGAFNARTIVRIVGLGLALAVGLLAALPGLASAKQDTAADLAGQARAAQRSGDYAQAEQLWSATVDAADTAGNTPAAASASRELACCRLRLEDYDGAAEAAKYAAEAYLSLADTTQAAQAYTSLGSLLRAAGEYERAAQAYHEALEVYVDAGDQAGQASAHLSLGILADLQGLLPLAASEFSSAREIFRALGDSANVALCYSNQGYALERLELADEALAAYEQAQYLYEEAGQREHEARILLARGRVQFSRGEYRTAQARYQSVLELLGPDEQVSLRAAALAGSGMALAKLDDHEAARAQLEEAWAIYETLKDYTALAGIAPMLADVTEALGDKAAAQTYREWRAPNSTSGSY